MQVRLFEPDYSSLKSLETISVVRSYLLLLNYDANIEFCYLQTFYQNSGLIAVFAVVILVWYALFREKILIFDEIISVNVLCGHLNRREGSIITAGKRLISGLWNRHLRNSQRVPGTEDDSP
jgi:hypothetical protein